MTQSIVFIHAALDESPQGECILRGVISPESLHLLQTADYQRDVLPLASINQLVKAFEVGSLPDIELGMRGESFSEEAGQVTLHDSVFIIDGLQRVTAAKIRFDRADVIVPRLGAVVHINTTEAWERERFRILNMDRTRLSPNVLLRNWRYDYEVIEILYTLTNSDKVFVLRGRVCWQQRMRREELITASTFARTVSRMHGHIGTGTGSGGRIDQVTSGLQRVVDTIGKNIFRDNVKAFFNVVDSAWGVKRVAFKEGAVYMHGTFLLALARLFSHHEDFWKGNRLFVEISLMRKLAQFPIRDPQVVQLSSSGGMAGEMLYMLMVEHINSGKRTKRLKSRYAENLVAPAAAEDQLEGEMVSDEANADGKPTEV